MVDRRPGRRDGRWVWWLVAGLAGAAYVTALVGATAAALVLAPYVRRALDSDRFRAALEAARHPVTEADLPRLLPGIPIYPGARLDPFFRKLTARSLGREGATVHLIASASPQQIRKFYVAHMTGWEFQSGSDDEDIIVFQRDREICLISILPSLPPFPGRGAGRTFTIDYSVLPRRPSPAAAPRVRAGTVPWWRRFPICELQGRMQFCPTWTVPAREGTVPARKERRWLRRSSPKA